MSIPFTPGSFQPPVGPYQKYENFYLWVQKTLPTIYDDTLSYQELLAKVLYQLNLIGEQGNQITEDVTALNTAYGELQDWANENIGELVSFVNDYFDNLDVQQEINNKLNAMAQDGSLSALLDPLVQLQIPDIVTGWLDDHVDPETGYVLDNSLSIAGAAADAKATGVKIHGVENALLTESTAALSAADFVQGGYTVANGTIAGVTNNRIRLAVTSYLTDKSITKITAAAGYSIAVLGWDASNNYLKLWDGSTWDYVTGHVWYQSLDLAKAWDQAAKISIQVSKGDAHSDNLTPSEGTNISITKYTPKYAALIAQLEADKVSRTEIDFNAVAFEDGGIDTAGRYVSNTNRVRTKYLQAGDYKIIPPAGIQIAGIFRYNAETQAFISATLMSASEYTVVSNGNLTKFTLKKSDNSDLNFTDVKNSLTLESMGSEEIEAFAPVVRFDIGTTLRDVSSYLSEIDYGTDHEPIIEQVTDLFDGLVSDYSGYVSRVDAAAELSLNYPEYANGVITAGTYEVTPAYKTYMYKFVDSSAALSNNNRFPKKKVLLISGIHGDEQAAPFNAYIFAKSLCTGATDDFKRFRAAFDLYVLPCVNGYGLYHSTRVNANGVNINRNYPVTGWSESGEPFDNDYTGPTANSEFETKIITGITNAYDFVSCFDHHNYARQPWQFYALVSKTNEMLALCYQSMVDCSIAFEKALPSYFGSGYKILYDASSVATSPGYETPGNIGTASTWWSQTSNKHSATIEISDRINYENGELSVSGTGRYSANAFAVGDYTLTSQIFRYSQATL